MAKEPPNSSPSPFGSARIAAVERPVRIRPGRRRLDVVKQEIICGLVAAGLSQRQAARAVGCSSSAIWKRAQADARFAQKLRTAHAASQRDALRKLQLASKRSWKAAAWFLERRFPERYGPQTILPRRSKE